MEDRDENEYDEMAPDADWRADDFEDCDEPYYDRDDVNAAFYDEWED